MKKDLATLYFRHSFFILISVYRDWLSLSFMPFWLGGIMGTLLPDIDYLIYVYVFKPKESSSQEVAGLISQRNLSKSWDTLNEL
jgi:hypothetical protein